MNDPNVIELLNQIKTQVDNNSFITFLAMVGIIIWVAVFSHKCKFKDTP